MQLMNTFELYLAPVGRIIVGIFFLLAGLDKLTNSTGTAEYIASAGLPAETLLAFLAAGFEIALGGALLAGFKAKLAALAIAIYVLFVTLVFHNPSMWAENPMQQVLFMKNIALFGSLLFIGAHAGMAATLSEDKVTPTPVATQ